MSEPAILIDHVSKAYTIGLQRQRAGSLGEAVQNALMSPFRRLRGHVPRDHDPQTYWALKDVSFQIREGEAIAIVGRNGAGKSTLLKILSRITAPTRGRVVINGRAASLLEVGTGFHPELTGRENIYLNGSLIGMRKSEIDRKFDQIVDFSGISRFLDTPVKRYSSGMYVRLAFSVAAHLETDILIIDEVLAVGDAEFQERCMGRMKEVRGKEGRTVIFVSHNMNAVLQLCEEAILLSSGEVVEQGKTRDVLNGYLDRDVVATSIDLSGDDVVRGRSSTRILRRVELLDESDLSRSVFQPGEVMRIRVHVATEMAYPSPQVGFGVNNTRHERVFAVASYLGPRPLPRLEGDQVIECRFTVPPLMPGKYLIDLSFGTGTAMEDEVMNGIGFEVLNNNYLETSTPLFDEMGSILVRSRWELVDEEEESGEGS